MDEHEAEESWAERVSIKLPGGRVVRGVVIFNDEQDPGTEATELFAGDDQHEHQFEDEDGWVICTCECPDCMTTGDDGEPTCICAQCAHNSGSGLPTHLVTAERYEGWWLLTVPAVPGAISQCRDLADAEVNIREAIACVLNVAMDSFAVIIQEKGARQE